MDEDTTMNSENRAATIAAFSTVMVVIAQMGGVILGVVAIAYLIGQNYLSAYFGEVGAPWAMTYFTYDQIAREGVGITSLFVIAFFISLIGLLNGTSSSKSLERWAKCLALIGSIPLIIVTVVPSVYLSAKVLAILSIIAGFCFAISAGATLGELVARLKDSKSEWKGYHLTLVLFVYLFVVSQAPSFSGRAKAEIDMNIEESSLPYISKEGGKVGEWRLLRPLGDKFLIVAIKKNVHVRTFKIVSVGEYWEITPKKP